MRGGECDGLFKMDDNRHDDGRYDVDHSRRCSWMLDVWRFAHHQIRLEPEGGSGVIYKVGDILRHKQNGDLCHIIGFYIENNEYWYIMNDNWQTPERIVGLMYDKVDSIQLLAVKVKEETE